MAATAQPLTIADLDEQAYSTMTTWFAEGPRQRLWVICWVPANGIVTAWPSSRGSTRYTAEAADLDAARGHAVRIAGLIAAGKTA